MKSLLFTLVAAALLCGCNKPDPAVAQIRGQVAELQSNVDLLRLELKQNAAVYSASGSNVETNVKLWTLDKLEDMELREVSNRFELQTNLQALIFKVGEIAVQEK